MATKKKSETDTIVENEKKYDRFVEEAKFISEYLKHIATLDTGSIVIMATFLQKVVQPVASSLISLATICLVISLTGVVITQHFLAVTVSHSTEDVKNIPTTYERLVYRVSTIIAFIGFIIGLSLLGAFIVYGVFNL